MVVSSAPIVVDKLPPSSALADALSVNTTAVSAAVKTAPAPLSTTGRESIFEAMAVISQTLEL